MDSDRQLAGFVRVVCLHRGTQTVRHIRLRRSWLTHLSEQQLRELLIEVVEGLECDVMSVQLVLERRRPFPEPDSAETSD